MTFTILFILFLSFTTIAAYAVPDPVIYPPAPAPSPAPIADPAPIVVPKIPVEAPANTTKQTIANKREKINEILAQITKLDGQLEMATERYNAEKVVYDQINENIIQKELFLIEQNALINTLQDKQKAQAAYLYKNGKFALLETLLQANSVADFFSTWSLVSDIAQKDADSLNDYTIAVYNAKLTRELLLQERIKSLNSLNKMNSEKEYIENQMKRRKNIIAGIEADIFRLQHPNITVNFSYSREDLVLSGPRSEVASYALNYLGKPYVWAAAGPNSFDCSGLTMFVYAHFGVSLPHSAAMQYQYGRHISKSELQSGDLVFFYSPIHHVGIYLGNGLMIHAPHAGDVVRIAPLNSNYVGAIRL